MDGGGRAWNLLTGLVASSRWSSSWSWSGRATPCWTSTFRAEPEEVLAFQHLGAPYFKASWGGNVVGLLIDEDTDWEEVAELLTDSYCLQAPQKLAAQVPRPG